MATRHPLTGQRRARFSPTCRAGAHALDQVVHASRRRPVRQLLATFAFFIPLLPARGAVYRRHEIRWEPFQCQPDPCGDPRRISPPAAPHARWRAGRTSGCWRWRAPLSAPSRARRTPTFAQQAQVAMRFAFSGATAPTRAGTQVQPDSKSSSRAVATARHRVILRRPIDRQRRAIGFAVLGGMRQAGNANSCCRLAPATMVLLPCATCSRTCKDRPRWNLCGGWPQQLCLASLPKAMQPRHNQFQWTGRYRHRWGPVTVASPSVSPAVAQVDRGADAAAERQILVAGILRQPPFRCSALPG